VISKGLSKVSVGSSAAPAKKEEKKPEAKKPEAKKEEPKKKEPEPVAPEEEDFNLDLFG
jgi:ribosomal protein L12E/L44/L45/RPP1/RPP2